MLRILFVTGSLVHGGAERHSITLMNGLTARGHECHAVYVKNDPSQIDRIRLQGPGTVHCLDAARYFDLRALADFAACLRRIRPDIIVAANAYALFYASLARRLARLSAPLLVTYHSTRLLGFKEQIKMLIDRFFFRAADCLVFVAANQRRYWRRRGIRARRNETIHNGIDITRFDGAAFTAAGREVRAAYGLGASDYVIGMVAVLRPEKNHLQLLSAVAALRRAGIPATALLIGDGPMHAAIDALAKVLDIERYVVVTGLREDVRPYIAACDVIALCSVTEAFSLAAIEAMAMSKPVVHSEVGGAAEMIVPGENGFLFPVGNTAALVQRLTLLAEPMRAQSMGARARRAVAAQFTEAAMLDRYEHTLLSLCQPAPPPRHVPAPATPERAGGPSRLIVSQGEKHHEHLRSST